MVPPISPKSYGVSVALAAIFGVLGFHHFYTGRWVLGFCDFGLCVASLVFIVLGEVEANDTYLAFALVLLALDILHTLFVTIRLLIGSEHDGQGRVIAYPGQFS